ncbi:MAG: PQQ-binding-like beta-propeller repeat protein, partial [Candidatus Eremiobacteraeota bacterium]|nr:PQQ-binding-like beta-propeller repeat protein [Candidatus Eremiobacteraeota bacterium]
RTAGAAGFSLRLPQFPLFHHVSHAWTQFRSGPDNNAVVGGKMEASWHLETGGQISSSPALVDGVLYVGNNAGRFYAIDPGSGRVRWTYRVGNPLMSAPIVYQDDVIIGEGDATSMGTMPSEPGRVGQGESALIALDKNTGTIRWMRAMSGSAMPSPAIVDGTLIEHDGAGWVAGFDPKTGHQRFAHKLESVASMSAILPMSDRDFVTTGVGTNAVWRMNARDGSVEWRSVFYEGASGIGDCPPVSDGARIMCDYVAPVVPDRQTSVGRPATERVFAVDAANGTLLWDVPLDTGELPPRNEAAIPLLAGGQLWVGSSVAPVMHAMDPSTGRVAWAMRAHGPIKGGAACVDGIVYFGDYGGYLWAVDARNDSIVGDMNAEAKFNVGSPLVVGRTLIVGTDSGALLAVPLAQIRNKHDT